MFFFYLQVFKKCPVQYFKVKDSANALMNHFCNTTTSENISLSDSLLDKGHGSRVQFSMRVIFQPPGRGRQ